MWLQQHNRIIRYHRKIIVFALLFFWRCFAGAQVITGIVCDKATKLPVSDIYVYLDGTSNNTKTNVSGRFELKTKSVFNTKLVLHHLSYETAIIDDPFNELPDTLYVKEKVKILRGVTILADRFTREQKMKVFREQFLGTTRAGKSCTIMNEDDIQFNIDWEARRLLASSENPVIVVNNYLGYEVSFILIDFWIQYGGTGIVSLDSEWVNSSFFSGVSSFTEIDSDKRRTKRRRDNVYELSSNYFFKSLANNHLKDNKFMIFNNSFPVDYRQYFTIKDTLSLKMLTIIPDTDINKSLPFTGLKPSGIISVLYRRSIQSDIYFMTDSFLVDRYGNIDQIDNVSFSGRMGKNRAGDMLPIDYEIE